MLQSRNAHRLVIGAAVLLSTWGSIRQGRAQTANDYHIVRVVNAVVNNTDPSLALTDMSEDKEPSFAINPTNPDELVMLSRANGSICGEAVPFHSLDRGQTWTKVTLPEPPLPARDSLSNGHTLDWGRNNELTVSFTTCNNNIVTGTTTDPTDPSAMSYLVRNGSAQRTNHFVPSTFGASDQAWVVVSPDPYVPEQDNVYVGYGTFADEDGVDGHDVRVAVAFGANPPDFIFDVQVGNANEGINPGLRIFADPLSGALYALWGRCAANCGDEVKTLEYMLNRSLDGGLTWSLDGDPDGAVVATAASSQPWRKFADVNAVLGGAAQAALDPTSGAIYYSYGTLSTADVEQLAIRRLEIDANGSMAVGPEHLVTAQYATLPQVAVDEAGVVGVAFYTDDGVGPTGLPLISMHLALSDDQGASFRDLTVLTFESPEAPDPEPSQRALGDFHRLRTSGSCFLGSFTGNGTAFGRPFDNGDPIFYEVCRREPPDVCLFASEVLDVQDRGVISADVGAANYLELGVEARLTGNAFVRGSVFARQRATFAGNLTVAGTLVRQTGVNVMGSLVAGLDVELAPLPVRSFAVSSDRQSVPAYSSATLAPGVYGHMVIYSRSVVTLSPGDYSFASLQIEPDVRVLAFGAVRLDVEGAFSLGDRSQLSAAASDPMIVYSNAASARIGTDTVVTGTIIAPAAYVNVASRSILRGCLGARHVRFEPGVVLDSSGASLPLQ